MNAKIVVGIYGVHADGTSRIQIIESKSQNPFIFDLLDVCFRLYGIRSLINTSFNSKENQLYIHLQML